MAKRLFDMIVAAVSLVLLSPIFAAAWLGIRLTSPGPALYKALRAGLDGTPFTMHKFRSMHIRRECGSVITGTSDPRIFFVGRLLRALKIDELPQLYDVLRGRMSIVGPRPEDPKIVEKYYDAAGRETLTVLPGLASPGSIFNYTHCHLYLDDADPELSYATKLLPIKLALELVYVRRRTLLYDLKIIARTLITILQISVGKTEFPDPPEMKEARRVLIS